MKYYAVIKGRGTTPSIYNSWEACKEAVIGFKGAIYKSFKTIEEANTYIGLHSGEDNRDSDDEKEILVTSEESEVLKIYVDGSYKVKKGNYSFGLVAILNNKMIHTDKGVGKNEEAAALRNVSGEMLGAIKAVEYALSEGFNHVEIYYDYQGIASWALGTWKRNNEFTQKYHGFMQRKMKDIRISFVKVKGHSGDKYNDIADQLAKEALEEEPENL